MQFVLHKYYCRFCICITVFTKVHTSIISSYIAGQIAGALSPGSLLLRRDQSSADCLFVIADLHASAAVSSVRSQFISFSTRLNDHPAFRCYLNDLFPEY